MVRIEGTCVTAVSAVASAAVGVAGWWGLGSDGGGYGLFAEEGDSGLVGISMWRAGL